MTTILVASDMSVRSDRAVGRAARLAHALEATLVVACVTDAALPSDIAERVVTETDARLRRTMEETARATPCTWTVSASLGDPVADILEQAEAVRADLVVLGLHRPRGFLDRLRETTMERIVRGGRAPVLLVRDPPDHDYAKVLAPTDFSPASAAALAAARLVAPDAACTAFHAVHIPFGGLTGAEPGGSYASGVVQEAEAARSAFVRAGGLPPGVAEPRIIEGAFGMVLGRQLEQVRPDLLAVGAHARATAMPWHLGGIAADLVREPPCDLLIARPAFG